MDLSQSTDWNLTFEQTLSSSDLPNFLVPSEFSSQVVAVFISTSGSKPTWYRAGYLRQIVPTGLISSTSEFCSFDQLMLLGGNVVFFPNNFNNYQIRIIFPFYFPNAFLSIYSYTGTIVTSDGILGQINSAISDILTLTTNVANIAQQIANIITIITNIAALLG